uniref:hypothetical protein n=1 Tax=Agathobacter rectalis TaxID=39491 RepID=UPI003FEE637F
MTVSEIMTILESQDRVRIMQGDVEICNQYFANIRADKELIDKHKDMQVKRFRVIPEIRHKRWKELNLMQPLRPEETPDFSFSDLQMKLYYTIYI